MRKLCLSTGILLILLGVVMFLLSGAMTSLIPTWIGIPFLLCAAFATTPARNKHAMHVAALVALLGASTLGMAVPKLVKAAGGQAMERPRAVYTQLGTGLICTVFLVAAVRSFVNARVLKKTGVAE